MCSHQEILESVNTNKIDSDGFKITTTANLQCAMFEERVSVDVGTTTSGNQLGGPGRHLEALECRQKTIQRHTKTPGSHQKRLASNQGGVGNHQRIL